MNDGRLPLFFIEAEYAHLPKCIGHIHFISVHIMMDQWAGFGCGGTDLDEGYCSTKLALKLHLITKKSGSNIDLQEAQPSVPEVLLSYFSDNYNHSVIKRRLAIRTEIIPQMQYVRTKTLEY